MQLGEYGLPLYSGASGALAAPSGVFVLRSSFQMIQLKSVSRFRKCVSIFRCLPTRHFRAPSRRNGLVIAFRGRKTHQGGFQRAVSLLTKNDPRHVGELVFVIGDAEMEPIRALSVTSRAERGLVERRTQGLIGSIVAAPRRATWTTRSQALTRQHDETG